MQPRLFYYSDNCCDDAKLRADCVSVLMLLMVMHGHGEEDDHGDVTLVTMLAVPL